MLVPSRLTSPLHTTHRALGARGGLDHRATPNVAKRSYSGFLRQKACYSERYAVSEKRRNGRIRSTSTLIPDRDGVGERHVLHVARDWRTPVSSSALRKHLGNPVPRQFNAGSSRSVQGKWTVNEISPQARSLCRAHGCCIASALDGQG